MPSALHPPMWVSVLGITAFLGAHTYLPQQLVASAIGTGTVVAIGFAGRRIAGARIGLIGAGIGAVYPDCGCTSATCCPRRSSFWGSR